MFNVAVVNKKDILKYLVSIMVTLCLVMLVTRYFSGLSKDEKNKSEINIKISEIMQTSLLICLDETIPGIKETNHELKNADEEPINENKILKALLKIELSMFNEEQKMAEIQNVASNQVEGKKANTKEMENENLEVARKCYYSNCNAKSIIG